MIYTAQDVIGNSVDIQNLQNLATKLSYEFNVYAPRGLFNSRSKKTMIKNYLLEGIYFKVKKIN